MIQYKYDKVIRCEVYIMQEKIKELRLNGLEYKKIATALNVSIYVVKYQCQKLNLRGVRANNLFEMFLDGFNLNHGDRFTYVSGFKDSGSPVLISCNQCGCELTRNAQISRKAKYLTCGNCSSLSSLEKEDNQKKERELLRIGIEEKKQEILAIKERERRKALTFRCRECGKTFLSTHKGRHCCSDKCTSKHKNRKRGLKRRGKLKENGKVDYSVTLPKLIKRDKQACALCGNKVNEKDYIKTSEGYFIAGNNYPSIDHILPVSKGGTHTWKNVQLAHRLCNSGKSDIIEESIQLKLLS